ncbi:MAG: hypothetical protein DME22_07415, partial [Verrucomicrobia bacterium]
AHVRTVFAEVLPVAANILHIGFYVLPVGLRVGLVFSEVFHIMVAISAVFAQVAAVPAGRSVSGIDGCAQTDNPGADQSECR